MKKCIVCKVLHNRTKFCSDKCKDINWIKNNYERRKEIKNKYNKTNYINNKDIRKEQMKIYREDNQEYFKKYNKMYYINNKDKLMKKMKDYCNTENYKKSKKKYYINNKEIIKEKAKNYYYDNINECQEKHKIYRDNNKEHLNNYNKNYYHNNKEVDKVRCKKWREDNKEYYREYCRKSFINKRNSDVEFRILCNLRRRIHHALMGENKSARTIELLGCDIDFLKVHLEKTALRNGYMNFNIEDFDGKDFYLDHVLPVSSFDLCNVEEQRRCFNFMNLQILSALDNLRKGSKV